MEEHEKIKKIVSIHALFNKFDMSKKFGCLYIVSTPIGNLDDITLRAIETLHKVDICACEDTRKSKILFNKYSIKTKLTSYHKFSEKSKSLDLIQKLKDGLNIALISDAGTPLVSDPGKYLVSEAIANDICISPIPGATSVIAALCVSGFDIEKFSFNGFFPRKSKEQKKMIEKLVNADNVSVFFESGKRLEKLLDCFSNSLCIDRKIFIAREMTKIHETFYRGTIDEVQRNILKSSHGLKGEFVVVLNSSVEVTEDQLSDEEVRVMKILTENLDPKLATKIGSKLLNKSRNQIYKSSLEN